MAVMVQRFRASLIAAPTAALINRVGLAIVVVGLVATVQRVATARGGATYFFQTMGFGLALGAIFALVALGYTMVYGIIELINFAHGDVFTLGAFISAAILPIFGLTEGRTFGIGVVLPLIGVFLVTMRVCALINVGIERVAYRPLRHAPRLAPLITAIGMSALLEGVMNVWRGPFTPHYPDLLPEYQIPLGGGLSIAHQTLILYVRALPPMFPHSRVVRP